MWTYINHYKKEHFTNPFYLQPPLDPSTGHFEYPRLARIPTVLYHELTLWKEHFLRYSPDNPRYHYPHKHGAVALTDDYRDSLMRDQLDLERTLRDLLGKSQKLLDKLRENESRAQNKRSHAAVLKISSYEMVQAPGEGEVVMEESKISIIESGTAELKESNFEDVQIAGDNPLAESTYPEGEKLPNGAVVHDDYL